MNHVRQEWLVAAQKTFPTQWIQIRACRAPLAWTSNTPNVLECASVWPICVLQRPRRTIITVYLEFWYVSQPDRLQGLDLQGFRQSGGLPPRFPQSVHMQIEVVAIPQPPIASIWVGFPSHPAKQRLSLWI